VQTLNRLKASGIVIAAAAVVAEFALGLVPVTQSHLAEAALGLGSGSVIPMLALSLEGRAARGKAQKQALRYLLTEKASPL
jgi:hypothetical protein